MVDHEDRECSWKFDNKEEGIPVELVQGFKGFSHCLRARRDAYEEFEVKSIYLPHQVYQQGRVTYSSTGGGVEDSED